ncbi:MAG: BTAD domain-containing putative transcriptional regulator, partial [Dermatophilaceae bacterium]
MIRLSVLGTVDLRDANNAELRQVVMQPKRLALLAYMAASARDVHRRDTLVGLFWPELDSERARGALSKALHHLRASLGPDVLVTRGDEEVLVERTHLWCDAAAFEQALDQGRHAEALGLYGGDLLKGFFRSDAPEFEHWVERERERLRQRATAAAWSLVDQEEQLGNRAGAASWARRAQLLSPDDEAGLRRLLAVLERAGDRAGAVRIYEEFVSHLAREYELTPTEETQALVDRIKAEPPVQGIGPRPTPPPPTPAPTTALDPLESPSVPPPVAQRRGLWLVVAGAALVVGAGSMFYLQNRGEASLLDPKRVLVAPFENRTGERELDPVGHMATDWIIQGLSQTGLVEVVPFTATLNSARLGPSFLDPGDTAERVATLAHETGAGLVIAGSYYLEGDSLVV